MTTGRRHGIKCLECNHTIKNCPKCSEPIYPDTNFSQWIRGLEYPNNGNQASCHNLDYVWFRFYDNWLITVEEKIKRKEYNLNYNSDKSQIQCHQLVRQMIEFSSGNKFDISFGKSKRYETITYRGHYVITFQNTNPADSQWCKINGVHYKFPEVFILCLLEFGILLSPDIDFSLPSPITAIQTGLSVGQASSLKLEWRKSNGN